MNFEPSILSCFISFCSVFGLFEISRIYISNILRSLILIQPTNEILTRNEIVIGQLFGVSVITSKLVMLLSIIMLRIIIWKEIKYCQIIMMMVSFWLLTIWKFDFKYTEHNKKIIWNGRLTFQKLNRIFILLDWEE